MTEQEFLDIIRAYEKASRELIGENIRRLTKQYKAEEIVEKTGVAIQTVYNWQRDYNSKPKIETALALCVALGVPFKELIRNVTVPNIVDTRPRCKNGCDKPVVALGLCQKCYQQQRRANK